MGVDGRRRRGVEVMIGALGGNDAEMGCTVSEVQVRAF